MLNSIWNTKKNEGKASFSLIGILIQFSLFSIFYYYFLYFLFFILIKLFTFAFYLNIHFEIFSCTCFCVCTVICFFCFFFSYKFYVFRFRRYFFILGSGTSWPTRLRTFLNNAAFKECRYFDMYIVQILLLINTFF